MSKRAADGDLPGASKSSGALYTGHLQYECFCHNYKNPWVDLDVADQEPVYTKTVYEQEQQMLQMMYRHHQFCSRRSSTANCWNELYLITIRRIVPGMSSIPVKHITKRFIATSESDSEPNSVSEDSD